MPENNNGNDNSGDNGPDQSGPSLEETAETTRALLESNLSAGVPAPEALENSRPRNWNS